LPEADDLLAGLLRVAEAVRTVPAAKGAGLTLVHEDGPPRWVAATDAAMELLEQIQHDFGEGPYLQTYAQDRAVAVEDLGAAPTWARLDAVGRVRQARAQAAEQALRVAQADLAPAPRRARPGAGRVGPG
jgi:hypothetical protein